MKKAVMSLMVMMSVSGVSVSAFAGVEYRGAPSADKPNSYQPCKELARTLLQEEGDINVGGALRLTNEPNRFAPVMSFDYEMTIQSRRNGQLAEDAIAVTVAFNQFTGKCSVK